MTVTDQENVDILLGAQDMLESIWQELCFNWELVEELASHVDIRIFKKNKQKALKENHNIVIKLTCVKIAYYALNRTSLQSHLSLPHT